MKTCFFGRTCFSSTEQVHQENFTHRCTSIWPQVNGHGRHSRQAGRDVWEGIRMEVLDEFFASTAVKPNKILHEVVVSNMFYFHPYLGRWSNLTSIFSNGLKPPTSLAYLSGTYLVSFPCHFCLNIRLFSWSMCVCVVLLTWGYRLRKTYPSRPVGPRPLEGIVCLEVFDYDVFPVFWDIHFHIYIYITLSGYYLWDI